MHKTTIVEERKNAKTLKKAVRYGKFLAAQIEEAYRIVCAIARETHDPNVITVKKQLEALKLIHQGDRHFGKISEEKMIFGSSIGALRHKHGELADLLQEIEYGLFHQRSTISGTQFGRI